MQELQDRIHELFAAKVAAGELDTMLRDQLDATIKKVVGETLGPWSDFAKKLTASMSAALAVDFDRLGLGAYNDAVASLVADRIDFAMRGEFADQLKRSVDQTLRHAPESVKLSEILAKLVEDNSAEAREEEWECATMLVAPRQHGATWVYFDPQERGEDERYRFAWSMLIDEDNEVLTVHSVESREHSTRPERRRLFGDSRFGLERYLFHLHVGKTKIVMDLEPGLHTREYPDAYG